MIITPDKFHDISAYDLLKAANEGKVGMDRRWLHAILDRGEQSIPDIVRFGTEDRSQDAVPLEDELLLICSHLRSPQTLPVFLAMVKAYPTELPDEFPAAIFPIREAALDPLLQVYEELEEDESGDVAFTLASFRIRDERVLRVLLDRLEYDTTEGAIALSLYGDPAAIPALEKMIGEIAEDEHLKKELQDAIDDIRSHALEQAEEPAEEDIFELFPEEALPESELFEDEELLEMLDVADPKYRFAAAAGFIQRDLTDESRPALLEHAQSDEEASVRAKCWEALAGEIVENHDIFEAMLARLQDDHAPVVERAGALVGLGQRADEEPIRRYAEEFYASPETRAAALSAMWNSLDRSFSKYFPAHLDDPDPEIRKQAISGVGYLGIYDSAEKLKEHFEDEEFRPNALFAYALSTRAEISPGRIKPLFRRIENAAGGLTEEEEELLKIALDERLMLHGHQPVFHAHPDRHAHSETESAGPAKTGEKAGRNDPCPCGSGKKYKKCCGA